MKSLRDKIELEKTSVFKTISNWQKKEYYYLPSEIGTEIFDREDMVLDIIQEELIMEDS